MRTDVFFDTNVLLNLADDGFKAERTEALLIDGGVCNALVIAEAAYVLTRKWRMAWPVAGALLATFRANTTVLPMSDETNSRGLRYAERYRLQTYNAAIVAAAVMAGCQTLWSEDMHDGLVIDGLTIRNPYRA